MTEALSFCENEVMTFASKTYSFMTNKQKEVIDMKRWYDRIKVDLIKNSEILASKETTDEERLKAFKHQADLIDELDSLYDLIYKK